MVDKIKTITLAESRYVELVRQEKELEALYQSGVDNWEGYEYAMESLWGTLEERSTEHEEEQSRYRHG
jgi:truncated hemoglobin YjbI